MTGQTYTAPAILLIAFALVAPSLFGLYLSLFNLRYMAPEEFVGFENYRYLGGEPEFLAMILRSLVFTVCAVGSTLVCGLAVALWINRLKGWFSLLVQIIVILPWILSTVVGALLFRWVFVNDLGLAAYIFEYLGFSFRPLGDAKTAMVLLIVFALWRTLGFTVVVLLAGIKSIPAELYEAAHVDGASAWQRLKNITLPMLKTPMLIATVILTVSNLNNVETPLIVTGGGPAGATTIAPLYLYTTAFTRFDFNTALAMGIGMLGANICLAFIYVKLVNKNGRS